MEESVENLQIKAEQTLHDYFGFRDFRASQLEAITSVLQGSNSLVVMPTGGGKSLCYQIPGLLFQGVTLVVSPLISLMKDQVDSLQKRNIPATQINSSLDYHEVQFRIRQAQLGEVKFLFVTPERLESRQFLESLVSIPLSFVVIDEAHCISEWGHDFRPSYLQIHKAIEFFELRTGRKVTIGAYTATATQLVQQDITSRLSKSKFNTFVSGFRRENLSYIVEQSSNKIARAVDYIKETKSGTTIIYCGSRKRVEETANELSRYGINAQSYHAGLSETQRIKSQDEFQNNPNAILVATNAFGMGVDKPNVRTVMHMDLTGSIEAYYQEAGRAGRDGKKSRCVILYSPRDRSLQDFFIDNTFPNFEVTSAVYNKIFDVAQIAVGSGMGMNLDISPKFLSKELNLQQIAVQGVLSFFERIGVTQRGASSANLKIKFSVARDQVRELYERTNGARKKVLDAILRGCSPIIFEEFIAVNIYQLSDKFLLRHEQLMYELQSLELSRYIEIQSQNVESSITIASNRVHSEELQNLYKPLLERKHFAEEKLKKVIEYVNTTECKEKFILEYFGEETQNYQCKRCSSCTTSHSKHGISSKQKQKHIDQKILECLNEFPNKFGKITITNILLGYKDQRTTEYKLDKSTSFKMLAHCTRDEIVSAIEKLIREDYVKVSDGQYPTISIGRRVYPHFYDSLKPFRIQLKPFRKTVEESALERDLKKVRDTIASELNKPNSEVISSKEMQSLLQNSPSNEVELVDSLSMGHRLSSRHVNQLFSVFGKTQDSKLISATVIKTTDLINKGYSIERVAEERNLSLGTVSMHVQEALENELDINVENVVSGTLVRIVSSEFAKNKRITLKQLRLVAPDVFDFAHLRIALAFVKNKSKSL